MTNLPKPQPIYFLCFTSDTSHALPCALSYRNRRSWAHLKRLSSVRSGGRMIHVHVNWRGGSSLQRSWICTSNPVELEGSADTTADDSDDGSMPLLARPAAGPELDELDEREDPNAGHITIRISHPDRSDAVYHPTRLACSRSRDNSLNISRDSSHVIVNHSVTAPIRTCLPDHCGPWATIPRLGFALSETLRRRTGHRLWDGSQIVASPSLSPRHFHGIRRDVEREMVWITDGRRRVAPQPYRPLGQ